MSCGAYASECDIQTKGLSAEAVRQMVDLCQKDLASQKTDGLTENVQMLGKIMEVSHEFSSSLGLAARELGYAANEFLASPAGILTATVIIWKVFMVQILGIIFLMVVIPLWIYMLRKTMIDKVEYLPIKRWGGREGHKKVVTYESFDSISSERCRSMLIISVFAIVLIAIIVGKMIT